MYNGQWMIQHLLFLNISNLLKDSSLSSHVRCVLVDTLANAHDHLPSEETLDTKGITGITGITGVTGITDIS